MKHCDIERDQKFRRSVSLLHNIIAMPVSNDYQPTLSQIREQDRQLLNKQAMEIEDDVEINTKRNGLVKRLLSSVKKIKSKALGLPREQLNPE